ncbi:hypothetical protein, partial [Halorubrum halodurans]|uniref:hypothetical protein n=1 Tax=Halorubrum halodurans TaxID=1383851 RepID=UPI001C532B8B
HSTAPHASPASLLALFERSQRPARIEDSLAAGGSAAGDLAVGFAPSGRSPARHRMAKSGCPSHRLRES